VYTGIHNEQEERKDYGKDQHRTGGYEQSKHIKYGDYHLVRFLLMAGSPTVDSGSIMAFARDLDLLGISSTE
jgi:hypothetical protein